MRKAVPGRILEGILDWRASEEHVGKLGGGAAPKCEVVGPKGRVGDSDSEMKIHER